MSHAAQEQSPVDRVIWRRDLTEMMGVSGETVRRWMNAGKLPRPDVNLSRRTSGWKLSTLRLAGIDLGLPALPPVPDVHQSAEPAPVCPPFKKAKRATA